MKGGPPVAIEVTERSATVAVAMESGTAERVEVAITSGRGEVTITGSLLDVARLTIEIDRQLSHLLAQRRQQLSGAR